MGRVRELKIVARTPRSGPCPLLAAMSLNRFFCREMATNVGELSIVEVDEKLPATDRKKGDVMYAFSYVTSPISPAVSRRGRAATR